MNKNPATTLGAIACGASLLLSGCGGEDTPERRSDAVGMSTGPAMPPVVPGAQPANPNTPSVPTPPVSGPMNPTAPPASSPDPAMPPPTNPMTPAPPGGGVPITPDATGWVQGDTNTVGIQGAWYGYNDCADSPADCTQNHVPAEGDFTNVGGKMCTSGTTAIVASGAEFGTKWGAGIALDLNAMGETKSAWNATAMGVTGFSFTIEFNTTSSVRVNLPTAATPADSHFYTVTAPGSVTVTWAEFNQGEWVKPPERIDTLDPAGLLSLQFQVPSKMGEAVAFDFCISNLTALK